MLRRYAFLVIILLAILTPATVAQNVTPDQVFALGFDAKQKGSFDKGEVIPTGFKELSDKELALFMAVIVPAPMEKVMEFSRSGGSLNTNKDVLAHGTLEGDDIKGFFAGINYEGAEVTEIDKLLAVKAGSGFNLSAAEMERFAALRKKFGKGCSKDAACSRAVMDEYRSVLEGRLKAYQAGGRPSMDTPGAASRQSRPKS